MEREDGAALTRKSVDIYHRYVEPLEHDHEGKYVAVSEDGRLVMASTLMDVMEAAEKDLPPGSFLYRVGDVALDRLR